MIQKLVVASLTGQQYEVDMPTAITYFQILRQSQKRTAELESIREKATEWADLIGDKDGEKAFDLADYAFSCAQETLEGLISEDLKTLDCLLKGAPRYHGEPGRAQATRALIESL